MSYNKDNEYDGEMDFDNGNDELNLEDSVDEEFNNDDSYDNDSYDNNESDDNNENYSEDDVESDNSKKKKTINKKLIYGGITGTVVVFIVGGLGLMAFNPLSQKQIRPLASMPEPIPNPIPIQSNPKIANVNKTVSNNIVPIKKTIVASKETTQQEQKKVVTNNVDTIKMESNDISNEKIKKLIETKFQDMIHNQSEIYNLTTKKTVYNKRLEAKVSKILDILNQKKSNTQDKQKIEKLETLAKENILLKINLDKSEQKYNELQGVLAKTFRKMDKLRQKVHKVTILKTSKNTTQKNKKVSKLSKSNFVSWKIVGMSNNSLILKNVQNEIKILKTGDNFGDYKINKIDSSIGVVFVYDKLKPDVLRINDLINIKK